MGEQKYFVISADEDGEVYVDLFDKEELDDQLNIWTEDGMNVNFIKMKDYAEWENDPQYWQGHSVLIIKGHIVVPKKEEVVTKYKID